jgi:hypothetical protein
MRRNHGHGSECRARHRPDGRRAEQDVTNDLVIYHGHERQERGAARSQRIDESPFPFLIEGGAIHTPNCLDVSRLFCPDLCQVVLRS